MGSPAAALGGLDALIFTAAIGAEFPMIRRRICRSLGWLGVDIDQAANDRGCGYVSPAVRSSSVWVIPIDEERVVPTDTWVTVRTAAAAKVSKRSVAPAEL